VIINKDVKFKEEDAWDITIDKPINIRGAIVEDEVEEVELEKNGQQGS